MSGGFNPSPVTVIVLTWNGLEVTRNCIRTLLERTSHPDFEVLVVDNGSTDGTLEYLRGVSGIRLVENGRNLGFVGGNNVGIAGTSGDVLLLNNDTEIVQPDWLERIQQVALGNGDAGIVGCRLVNGEGRLVHAGTYMPVPSFWGQEYPGDEKDIGQYSRDREVEGVIAACFYIKRELIDAIGPLDTDYFSYYEDTDYCLKAKREGYRVFCCGTTVVHLENASTDLNRMDFSGTFRKSREVFLSKWKDYYDSFYTRQLTWHSFISGDGLFSRASSGALWALDRSGVDVNLGFLEGADRAELDDFRINDMKNRGRDRDRPQVLFGPPGMLSRADGTRNVGYVFTPFDRFKPEWVAEMNRMDELWVPCGFQKQAALDSGVKRPVSVVPIGLDPDYLNPGIKDYGLEGRYCFLAEVEWGPSAAAETLLRAFTDEFEPEDGVVMVMKVRTTGTGAEVEEEVEAMNLPMERARVVFVIDHEIPGYQAGSLYRSADCLVICERWSGTGLQAAEALACGTPVIAPEWGPYPEMAEAGGIYCFACGTSPSPEEGLLWAEPGYEAVRAAMRNAFSNKEEYESSALDASASLLSERDWDSVAGMMIERIDGLR